MTATPPLEYAQRIGLHHARLLIFHAGHNGSTTAAAMGYESASEFGREFKRFFGASPGEEATNISARPAAGGTPTAIP